MVAIKNKAGHPQKILYLESLRGLAALSVVLYHCRIDTFLVVNSFVRNSWLFVDFFFVLSGLVISMNYQTKLHKLQDVLSFQLKRFLRLYPLHFLMLIMFLILETAKQIAVAKFGLSVGNITSDINNVNSFIHNLFLTQNLFINHTTWNYPSWSISAEFYTYMVFALLTRLLIKWKWCYLLACSILSLIAVYSLFNNGMGDSQGFQRCLYSFFLGVILYNIYKQLDFKLSSIFSYVILIIVLVMIVSSDQRHPQLAIFVPIMFSVFLLSLLLSDKDSYLVKLLENPKLVYLGTISYGVYMVHFFMLWVLNQLLRFVFSVPYSLSDSRGVEFIFVNDGVALIVLGITLSLIILVAHLSYKYFEKPCANLLKKSI